MSMISIINEIMLLAGDATPDTKGFMGAVITGVQIVGIGMIGWSSIKAAQEGDIWNAATRIVIGGVTLAFITEQNFREYVMKMIHQLSKATFGKFT